MRSAVRAAAWLLVGAIVILSVVPAHDRPITPLPHNVEHFAIFVLTGLAFGLGYQPRFLVQAIGLVSFCGAIEIAQLGAPSRHARFTDFLVDALSVILGVALSALAVRGKQFATRQRADQ